MKVLYIDYFKCFKSKIEVLKDEFFSKWKIQIYFEYKADIDKGIILLHNCNNDKTISAFILGDYIRSNPTTSDIKGHLLFIINNVWED